MDLKGIQGQAEARRKQNIEKIILLLSMAFKFLFWLRMPYNWSTHDIGAFLSDDGSPFGFGHLGFIQYLFLYGKLPDFDPTTIQSFYNPPLYHATVAALMRVLTFLGIPVTAADKAATFVPLVCCCILTWLIYRISLCLPMQDGTRAGLVFLLAWHPSLVLLSATPTNDAMSLMFSALSVLLAMRWYQVPLPGPDGTAEETADFLHRSRSLLIALAFAIGLGMAAKASTGLIAPAVAALFLKKLWDARKTVWKKMLPAFVLFGVICVPIGLYTPIRNRLLFGTPITYVQGDLSSEFLPETTAWMRFGFPGSQEMTHLIYDFDYKNYQCNVWAQTIKTSLFDERLFESAPVIVQHGMAVLAYLGLALALVYLGLFLYDLVAVKEHPIWQRMFFGLGYLALMVFYIRFNITYPHGYTASFRYVVIAMILCILGTGPAIDHLARKYPRVPVRAVLNGASGLLCGACAFLSLVYPAAD